MAGRTKCGTVDSPGDHNLGGEVVGADYRQHDRLCMQDDKASFRQESSLCNT